jgi:hypothetical protein
MPSARQEITERNDVSQGGNGVVNASTPQLRGLPFVESVTLCTDSKTAAC